MFFTGSIILGNHFPSKMMSLAKTVYTIHVITNRVQKLPEERIHTEYFIAHHCTHLLPEAICRTK